MFKVILAGILFSLATISQGQNADDWRFSGFASLGVGRIYEDGQRALGYENEWSFDSDSVLGLQLDKELSERWGFTGQVVANGYNYTGDELYTPELEWLLLRFEPTGDMQFRFGRVRNPMYLYSTTLEVGYTYPWVRPSANTYPSFLDPFKHLDGMDFVYSSSYSDLDVEYQLFAGRSEAEFIGLDITAHSVFGANITTRWSEFTWRFNAEELEVSILAPDVQAARDGFNGAALQASALNISEAAEIFTYVANNLEAKHKSVHYLSTSFMWEPNQWTFMTEVMHFRNEDNLFSNDADGFYISVAYLWGDYTPYITYGEFHNRFADGLVVKIKESEEFIPVNPSGSDLDFLRESTVSQLNDYDTEQESIVFGLRYDFHNQANLKVEVEYFNFINDTSGVFYVDPGNETPNDGLMTSFVIDVVF